MSLRKYSANIFLNVIKECNFLIPQYTPAYCENSYWAFGIKYEGLEKLGVTWKEFRRRYLHNGGDGIYGAWSVPYLEPVMVNRSFVQRLPQVYDEVHYYKGLCPIAEKIQSQMMVFKTNYRSEALAEIKAEALRKTIREFQ